MSTILELKKRADALRSKTEVNSVTPDEVGSLIYDTIDYMYIIESSGIFKMMSALAETKTPSSIDHIPVIGAEVAQKASIKNVVSKGILDADTHTDLESVPVIKDAKLGLMTKTSFSKKVYENYEQTIPWYKSDTDSFDQIKVRKSTTGESYYISKSDMSKVVSGLLGIVGYNILISPGTGIKISNLTVSCDIKVIISNGPSWATEKPNEILIHSPFDSGNPNITVWKILEGHGFSNIKIYRRNQDVYIENLYTYSTRFSILVLSDNVNNILVSTVLLSDINLMEEEILAIGN